MQWGRNPPTSAWVASQRGPPPVSLKRCWVWRHDTSMQDMARKLPRCPEPLIIPQDRGATPWCGDEEGRRRVDTLVAERPTGGSVGRRREHNWRIRGWPQASSPGTGRIRGLAAEFTEICSAESCGGGGEWGTKHISKSSVAIRLLLDACNVIRWLKQRSTGSAKIRMSGF